VAYSWFAVQGSGNKKQIRMTEILKKNPFANRPVLVTTIAFNFRHFLFLPTIEPLNHCTLNPKMGLRLTGVAETPSIPTEM
jgi:hypothetical protein